MQSPNQLNWNNQSHQPQQYTYYQQQPNILPQPVIYQQQYQPMLMTTTTSTATSPIPIIPFYPSTIPNTYYPYSPMMVAGAQQMVPRVIYVQQQPMEEQIASQAQTPMIAGSTVVTVSSTATADKVIAGELSPAPKSTSSKMQPSTIKINS